VRRHHDSQIPLIAIARGFVEMPQFAVSLVAENSSGKSQPHQSSHVVMTNDAYFGERSQHVLVYDN
jgi:hypothetical protein